MRDTASETLALPLEESASSFSSPITYNPIPNNSSSSSTSMFDVRCWMFNVRCSSSPNNQSPINNNSSHVFAVNLSEEHDKSVVPPQSEAPLHSLRPPTLRPATLLLLSTAPLRLCARTSHSSMFASPPPHRAPYRFHHHRQPGRHQGLLT